MNTAEWILVAILSLTLLGFLIVGIVLFAKLIGLTKEAKKVITTSQSIAEKADDVVDNVKDLTSVGGLVKTFVNRYTNKNNHKKGGQSGQKNQ